MCVGGGGGGGCCHIPVVFRTSYRRSGCTTLLPFPFPYPAPAPLFDIACMSGGGGRGFRFLVLCQQRGMSYRTATQSRAALFEGARASTAPTSGTSVYDDETAKMMEANNNAQQEELHQKILRLKAVGAKAGGGQFPFICVWACKCVRVLVCSRT